MVPAQMMDQRFGDKSRNKNKTHRQQRLVSIKTQGHSSEHDTELDIGAGLS